MELNKEWIESRVNRVKDPVQKVMLREILSELFVELYEYNNACYHSLEEKIKKEKNDFFHFYDVYTAVCRIEDFDPTNPYWFAVAENEVKREEHHLERIFLECDFDCILEFMNQTYTAKVVMEKETKTIRIGFSYVKEYMDKIQWLYDQFEKNKVKWHTINGAFLYKFLEIVDLDGVIPVATPIKKIEVNFGKLGKYVHTDRMLVWNLEEDLFQTEGIKVAGEMVIQYEHFIPFTEQEDGYLFVLEEDSFFLIREEQGIIVRTEQKAYEEIKGLHFVQYDSRKDGLRLCYPPQTNGKDKMLFNPFQNTIEAKIMTLGEIRRVLGQYQAFTEQELRLEKIDVKQLKEIKEWKAINFEKTDAFDKKEIIDLDCNPFIQMHQLWNREKVFLFHFTQNGENKTFITKDIIAFLISEIQLDLLGYQCVGVLE